MKAQLSGHLLAALLLCSFGQVFSQQNLIFAIRGNVTVVEDSHYLLGGSIAVGDIVAGRINFNLAAVDENIDPTVGDYWHKRSPNGMRVRINGKIFKSGSAPRELLVELVNRPPERNGDAMVFRSYKNIFPIPFDENHISWQLDDPTGTALSNVDLPAVIDLSVWKQIFGLTITGRDRSPHDPDRRLFIRAVINKVLVLPYDPVLNKDFDSQSVSDEAVEGIPADYRLLQNRPNPFNPSTVIGYDLPEDAFVNLRIYDLLGKEIRTLVDAFEMAGVKSVRWDGTNNLGHAVGAGVYIYRLEADGFSQTKKLILAK